MNFRCMNLQHHFCVSLYISAVSETRPLSNKYKSRPTNLVDLDLIPEEACRLDV